MDECMQAHPSLVSRTIDRFLLPFPSTLVCPTLLITQTQYRTQVGFGGSKWQRRFLVLQGTSLSVYATPESAGPLRTIPLAGLVVRTEVRVCVCICVCLFVSGCTLMCMWVSLYVGVHSMSVDTHTSNPIKPPFSPHSPTHIYTRGHSSLLPQHTCNAPQPPKKGGQYHVFALYPLEELEEEDEDSDFDDSDDGMQQEGQEQGEWADGDGEGGGGRGGGWHALSPDDRARFYDNLEEGACEGCCCAVGCGCV